MNIKRLIVATNNNHKLSEIKSILKDINIPIFSLKELGIVSNPVENGKTFKDNALIKARDIKLSEGDAVLADDSGLEIDYLSGRPGVHTSRYMGEDTPHSIKMQGILDEMKDSSDNERSARFRCVMALRLYTGEEFIADGTMEGRIAHKIDGSNGFGYDPIFIINEFNQTAALVTSNQKNSVSHRAQALAQINEIFKTFP